MELVLASTNIHKTRELRSLLKPLGLDLLSLRDFPSYIPPEETEDSFEGNALLKAKNAALSLRKPCLADDSGLVVPALGGLPGVHSATYAGPEASDRENCVKLLSAMKHLQDNERDAYFVCILAVVFPEGETKLFQGMCEGTIIQEMRGGNGFSYDSVFRKHDYSKTFAELDEETKSRISHRRKAWDKALLFLEAKMQEDALLD